MSLQGCPLLVANAFVFGAFGNSAGVLPFARAVALKTVHAIFAFTTPFTSRAGSIVINFRILGHN